MQKLHFLRQWQSLLRHVLDVATRQIFHLLKDRYVKVLLYRQNVDVVVLAYWGLKKFLAQA